MNSILIVAAEASSALYGERLLDEFQKRGVSLRAWGIGSKRMKEKGFELLESAQNMAVVGLTEVWEKWGVIKNAYKTILKKLDEEKPAVALLMDYPGFNLRLAKELKKRKIPVVYFISPQVWAWKKGRVKVVQKVVDRMLVVFPFEKAFYDQHDVESQFVGHPLVDEWERSKLSPEARKILRNQHGLSEQDFVLGIMPGSRDGEITRHLESQLEVCRDIVSKNPAVKVLLLVAPTLEVETMKAKLPTDLGFEIRVVKDEPFKMLQIFDSVLVASGTATLMVALAGVPMVIMYRMKAFSGWLARKIVSGKYFGLPNLILDREVVPEYFQSDASKEVLTEALLKYIDNPDHRARVRKDLDEVRSKLGGGGAVANVTDCLSRYLVP